MLAPNVLETSTTTGTGSFTLGGALTGAGCVTFNSVFSNTTTDAGLPFKYHIWSSDRTQWETGWGHLSASGTLVRDFVLANSSGTIAKINFNAGTKYVAVCDDGAGTTLGLPATYANTTKIAPGYYGPGVQIAASGSAEALTADRIYYLPYRHDYMGTVDAILCRTTSSSGGNGIGAIYTIGSDGQPAGRLPLSAAAVSLAAAGIKASTFTARTLPPGWYFLAINTNTTGATNTFYQMEPIGGAFSNVLGSSGTSTCTLSAYQATAYSATYTSAFPQAAGSFTYADSSGSTPWLGLRAA